MYDITYQYQLEIIPPNKVLVPGCEPTSALTSNTLHRSLDCGKAMVDVEAALAAIPGSYIKAGINFGTGNLRRRWFVLPPINPSCPCTKVTDYYRILKELANLEAPVEEVFDYCDVIGQGFCPAPDFDTTPTTPPNTYFAEGEDAPGYFKYPLPPNSWEGA